MFYLSSFFTIVACFSWNLSDANAQCTWRTSTVTGWKYCYNNRLKQTYAAMESWCVAQGLAMISFGGLNAKTTMLEADFIGSKLAELQTMGSWTTGYLLQNQRSGTGVGVRADYKDKNGRTLLHVDDLWSGNEPNGAGQNCVVVHPYHGPWLAFDNAYTSTYPTVCWHAAQAQDECIWHTSAQTGWLYCFKPTLRKTYSTMGTWCSARGWRLANLAGLTLAQQKAEGTDISNKLGQILTISNWYDSVMYEQVAPDGPSSQIRSKFLDADGRNIYDSFWSPAEPNNVGQWCMVSASNPSMGALPGRGVDSSCGGSYPITCLARPRWCTKLPGLANGQVFENALTMKATYTCNGDYVLTVNGVSKYNDGATRSCVHPTWLNPTWTYFCNAPCIKPAASAGLNIAGSSPVLHGKTIAYSCQANHLMYLDNAVQPAGTAHTKTCTNGALGNNQAVECKAVCTTPSLPNGAVTGATLNPTNSGDSITLTCNAKYYLTLAGVVAGSQSTTRSCSSGVWSDSRTAQCPIRTCTKPDAWTASLNIAGSSVVEIDKTITYTCDTDYLMTVDGTFMASYDLTCLDQETWEERNILCYAPCDKPASSVTLSVSGNSPTLHLETVTFSCAANSFMEIDGVKQPTGTTYSKTCSNGAFGDLKTIVCKGGCELPTLANGVITGSAGHGGSITLVCNTDYAMMVNGLEEPANTRTKSCSDGNWDDISEVRCSKDPCTRPTLANGVVVDNSQWFWAGPVIDGNTAAYYCKDGYTLSVNGVNQLRSDPTVPEKYFRKCLGAEAWEKTDSVECLGGCDVPTWEAGTLSGQTYLVNGTERVMVAIGDVFTYSCPSDYVQTVGGVAQASDYVTTCTASNVWLPTETVECIAPCTTTPEIVGGTVTGPQPTPHQSSLTFTCPSTLLLNEVEQAGSSVDWTCVGDDVWSSSDKMECVFSCDTTIVSNALPPFDAVSKVKQNEEAYLACAAGYRPQHLALKCVGQNAFDQTVPDCRQVCEIPQITNGTLRSVVNEIADYVEVGAVADRVCFGWFETTDTSQAVCQPDGTFDSIHECKPYCLVPNIPNGGFVDVQTGDLVLRGASLTPLCDDGFTLSDPAPSVCLDATYDKLHSCIPEGCFVPHFENGELHIAPGVMVPIGATLTATCAGGYRMSDGHDSAICLDNGMVDLVPVCVNTNKQLYPIIGVGVGSLIGILVAAFVCFYDRSYLWMKRN